jgi:hypothetical protein
MNDGGTFIFDAFVPDLIMLVNGVHNQMDFEGEYEPGRLVRRFVTTEPDLIHQTILVNFHMEWQEGGGWKQDDWSVPLRFFFRYELEHLIERSDFREYTIYGDYSGSRLDKNSREFVVVCRK